MKVLRCESHHIRRGITLIEVVVCMTVLGVLIALGLPATLSVRERSRVISCCSHQHQLSVAIANYETTFCVLPLGEASNLFHGILPFVGQDSASSTIEEINWQFSHPLMASLNVPVFVCPSDHMGGQWHGLWPNYIPNEGTGMQTFGRNGVTMVGSQRSLKNSDFTDGTSNTAMLSERRIWETGIADERRAWFTLSAHRGPSELADFVCACEGQRLTPVYPTIEYLDPGVTLITYVGYGYDHVLPPNSPSCFNGPPSDPQSTSVFTISSSSSHHGGVNVLMAGGEVKFVANSIDRVTWKSFGSRNGND